ncbi:MAG: hypothetical protein IK954_08385 [Clostridia bacterium]|nr:hypothetical protein [Clostridia bacterium]
MAVFEQAEKIWIDTADRVNVYADFTDAFTLPETFEAVTLSVSADSNYLVTVNGRVVGSLQYADFPDYKVYDTYDITPYVHTGENSLLVTGYCQGESSLVYRKGEAGVLYEVTCGDRLLCCSSAATLCRPTPGYQSDEVERLTFQLSFSFRYDAVGAETPKPWRPCVVRKGYDAVYPRPIPRLKVGDRPVVKLAAQGVYTLPHDKNLPAGDFMKHSALVTLSQKEMGFDLSRLALPNAEGLTLTADGGDGIFVLVDLLREEAGLLDLEFELPDAGDVYIGVGEHLNNLRVATEIETRQFAAVYRAKAGRNRFTHRFKRLAGRYLQLHFPSHRVTLHYAGLLPVEYPVTDCGGLVCNDKLHARIYEVAKRTLQLCMHEHYEDCPWREQALYGMDSRVEMLCTYRAFGDTAFAKASLRLFAHAQRENGQLELCAPADAPIYIPSFSLCYVISCAEYLAATGDKAFLREIYPVLQKLIRCFAEKQTVHGVIGPCTEPEAWNFYEWAPGLDGREPDLWPPMEVDFVDESTGKVLSAPLNAYFSLALEAYAAIAEALGETADAASAQKQRETVNTALHTLFWDADNGEYFSYVDDGVRKHKAELTQALLLVCGAVPPDIRPALRRRLYEYKDWVPMTMGSMIHRYEALLQEPETYRGPVFDEVADRWGEMLFHGATSFWETFTGVEEFTFGGATSLCHGWGALPIYLYYTYGADAPYSGFSIR